MKFDEIPQEVLNEIQSQYVIDWSIYEAEIPVPENCFTRKLRYTRTGDEQVTVNVMNPETFEMEPKVGYPSEQYIARGIWDDENKIVKLWSIDSSGMIVR